MYAPVGTGGGAVPSAHLTGGGEFARNADRAAVLNGYARAGSHGQGFECGGIVVRTVNDCRSRGVGGSRIIKGNEQSNSGGYDILHAAVRSGLDVSTA